MSLFWTGGHVGTGLALLVFGGGIVVTILCVVSLLVLQLLSPADFAIGGRGLGAFSACAAVLVAFAGYHWRAFGQSLLEFGQFVLRAVLGGSAGG